MKTSHKSMQSYFYSGATRSYDFRIDSLKKLLSAINKYEDKILTALNMDLCKSATEGYITEIGLAKNEIDYYISNLSHLMKRKKVRTPILIAPSKSYIYPDPKGIVLIISPWNYPFLLTISPLIASIATGNCAMLKPSELSPYTAKIISDMISETYTDNYIAIYNGDKDVVINLLNLPFDHIFFTGSSEIGKSIMKKASDNLTPVTLELGGKSPTIVDKNIDVKVAAKRIIWGKFINAGQTCITPDYIICHKDIKDELIKEMIFFIEKFYSKTPLLNNEYPKIINKKHFDRLLTYITKKYLIYGGSYDEKTLKIAPTILADMPLKHPTMNEEIFGPIIPIITYSDRNEMIKLIRSKPKPLALYLFTDDNKFMNEIIETIQFGGGVINDTLVHLLNNNLGFGGVGNSGMGSYHGVNGFREFSHYKSMVIKSKWFDIPLRYPPYKNKLKLLKFFMK